MFSKIFKVVIIGLTFISLFVSANTSKEVFYNGNYYNLSIPEGFCDITDNSTGKFMKSFLNDSLAKAGGLVSAKVIFSECGKEIDPINLLPWGYIGMGTNKDVTQRQFNKFTSKNMNSNFMNNLEDIVNKSANKTLEDYDLSSFGKIEIDMGKPEVLWSDDNSLIVYVRASDGNILQDGVFSTTVLPKAFVYTYLYDDVKNNPNILGLASKLNKVAIKNIESN